MYCSRNRYSVSCGQDIHPNSPAGAAGLRSFTDYIIGTADGVLHDPSDFYLLVEQAYKRPLRLYVYNSDDDSCREVTIVPDLEWGGEGRYVGADSCVDLFVTWFSGVPRRALRLGAVVAGGVKRRDKRYRVCSHWP